MMLTILDRCAVFSVKLVLIYFVTLDRPGPIYFSKVKDEVIHCLHLSKLFNLSFTIIVVKVFRETSELQLFILIIKIK